MIWILIAHRAGAQLFKSSGNSGDIQLIRDIDFPKGRRKNREIDTDAKGSYYSSVAGSGSRSTSGAPGSHHMKHGLDRHVEAVEHIADVFAKELAQILRLGRTHNEFNELILAAEPGFLGKIQHFLDKETEGKVSATLSRNLNGLPTNEIIDHLDELIRDSRKVA